MSERLTKYNHVIVTEGKKIEFKCSTCGTLNVIAPSLLTRDIKSNQYLCCDPIIALLSHLKYVRRLKRPWLHVMVHNIQCTLKRLWIR